jgi:hypothetical protein
MPGRIDLAAPGSRLMAIRSKKPVFMCGFMWGLSAPTVTEEKILVLWLNSAIFFLQLLSKQTVTRGSWVGFHSKHFARADVLNLKTLSNSTIEHLVNTYDELSNFEWPSLLDQYSSPPEERRKLDKEILKALGVTGDRADEVLSALYKAITKALNTMLATMSAD